MGNIVTTLKFYTGKLKIDQDQTLNNQSKTELKFYLPKSILKLKSEYTKDEIKEILNIYINYLDSFIDDSNFEEFDLDDPIESDYLNIFEEIFYDIELD